MTRKTLNPETALNQLRRLIIDRDTLEQRISQAVIEARRNGASWQKIAAELGITKQRAHQIYAAVSTPAPSKILDADVAGDSVTPSIFLDPIAPAPAPAKPKKATKKPVKEQFPDNKELWPWIHALTADSDKYEQDPSYPAQPGTGKGPHACPSCGQTNHHGYARSIKFLADCTPTKYDPPATVDTMTEWKATK